MVQSVQTVRMPLSAWDEQLERIRHVKRCVRADQERWQETLAYHASRRRVRMFVPCSLKGGGVWV